MFLQIPYRRLQELGSDNIGSPTSFQDAENTWNEVVECHVVKETTPDCQKSKLLMLGVNEDQCIVNNFWQYLFGDFF
jgi:hypothetical protein